MAGSVNKAIIVGNLGKDPEIRTTQSGDKIANLSIATSESWKDKQTGERKEKTEWHKVAIMNSGLSDVAERFLKKGSTVYIEGQIQTRKWTDQSGQERYSTEIVVGKFNGVMTLLGGKSDSGNQRQDDYQAPPKKTSGGTASGWEPPEEWDSEIPFVTRFGIW